MRVPRGRSLSFFSLPAVTAAACVSHSSSPATAPTTTTTPSTIDPGGAGHPPTEPADFPPQLKGPPGYKVVEYQWSGTPGTPFRKLSASWTGPWHASHVGEDALRRALRASLAQVTTQATFWEQAHRVEWSSEATHFSWGQVYETLSRAAALTDDLPTENRVRCWDGAEWTIEPVPR